MKQIQIVGMSPNDLIEQFDNIVKKRIDELKTELKSIEIKPETPLDDLIPKSEVRGKIASSSTLWKYEKEGKIKSYAIGGKRFYKRSELMEAFTELKQ